MQMNLKDMQKYVLEMVAATIEVCEKNNITYYCQAGTVLGAVRHNGIIPWDHDADLIIPENEIDYFVTCARRDLPDKYWVDYCLTNLKGQTQFPRIALKGYSSKLLHVDIFRLIGLPDDPEEQLRIVAEARGYTANNGIMKLSLKDLFTHGNRRHIFKRIKWLFRPRKYYLKKFLSLCGRYPYEQAHYVMNPSGKYGKKNIFRKEIYGEGHLWEFDGLKVRIPSEYDFYLKQYYNDYMQLPSQDQISKEMDMQFDVR